MRKGFGIGLSVLGGFLVMMALLAQFYAPGQLMKTPLNIDTTTLLSGEAEISDGSGGTSTYPVRAFSVTRSDSDRSDDKVVVWQNSTCLVIDENSPTGCVSADDPDERLLSATTDNFATDRKTALAVNDPKYLSAGAQQKEGLMNKFPFETEQKTYPYWEGTSASAVDATFVEEKDDDGLKVYVFKVSVANVPTQVTAGVNGTFSTDKEIWVEPTTGSIVNQIEHQQRLDDEGNVFLEVDLAFTDAQREASVKEAKEGVSGLKLIRKTIPLIGFLVGIPALIAGLVLAGAGRKKA